MTSPVALVKALRPRQWAKNLILFAALVFSENTFNGPYLVEELSAFAVFCLLSSAGYLYNDLRDIEADRQHPTKRHRPLASGELAPGVAVGFILLGVPLTLLWAWTIGQGFFFASLAYLFVTLSYSFYFKHIVILDVMVLGSGFVLRAVAGALSIDVPISPWFLVCIGFGALFLGMNKRHAELLLLGADATAHRKNLQDYTPRLLQQMLDVVTSATVMSYALYTISSGHSPWLMTTIPFMVYGIFRYQYLVAVKGEGGAPTDTFFKDRALQIDILLFLVASVIALRLE